ncbi:MAG: hypothetical protein KY455_08100, partial [Euryarchaeota archaeon]|nr:hypothetical protein [Euryarchaeota archaeon]
NPPDQPLALDRTTERREALERALHPRNNEEPTPKTDIDECDTELEELKDAVSGDSAQRLEKEHYDKKKEQAKTTEEINDLEKAADRARRRLAELRAMKEASEGVERAYSRAVDAVLTARDKGTLHGVCGTIAELGQVDAKNANAIETAAGPRTQCIVTESAADAQAAIEYLRKNNLGRATFLPLDKMTGNMPRGKALMVVKDPASLGFALDLITFNKRYEKAFQYVFGDTVVVHGLDDARRLMGGVRLVTQKGDLIEASGAMSGGSNKKDKGGASAFGGVDTAELEKVTSELRAAETHLETLTEQLTTLRSEIHDLEDRLREAKGSSEDVAQRVKKLEQARSEAAKKLETAKEAVFKQSGELDTLDDEMEAIRAEVGAMNDHLAELDAERERLSSALLSGTKKELADRIRKMETDLAAAKDAYRDAEQKRSIAKEKARLVQERVQEYQAKIARTVEEQARHKADIERFKVEIKGFDAEIDALESTTREASEAVAELQDEKDLVKDKLSEIRIKIDKKATEAETGYSLIAKEKDALPAIEEQLGEVLVELSENHYTQPDDEELPPLDVLKKNIREIEWSINQLGPINQRALEEYEEQEKRRDELVGEVEHLNEERAALQQLVDEIVGKKKSEFMEVFDAINANFRSVFERLSEGGTAHLELEDPEDPFNGGLTIKARPKGKRVLRIDALSGGEKSMTALGFIFAIQEYEPSPFYYLDEVDQNLDGVNSHTIGRTVKENSKSAQFIVVSLRKVTLKQADHIYGVTMQRVGVSEMVGNFDIDRIDESGNETKRGKGRKEAPLDEKAEAEAAEAVVTEEVAHG